MSEQNYVDYELTIAGLRAELVAVNEKLQHEQEQRKGNFEAWRAACETIKLQNEKLQRAWAAVKLTQFGFDHRRCNVCGGWGMSPHGETDRVHTKTCPVGLVIREAEAK